MPACSSTESGTVRPLVTGVSSKTPATSSGMVFPPGNSTSMVSPVVALRSFDRLSLSSAWSPERSSVPEAIVRV